MVMIICWNYHLSRGEAYANWFIYTLLMTFNQFCFWILMCLSS